MSDTMFKISVENLRTREKVSFLGQGEGIEAALKDGIKNTQARFRPRDGDKKAAIGVQVEKPDGSFVNRSLSEFEAGPKDAPVVDMGDFL